MIVLIKREDKTFALKTDTSYREVLEGRMEKLNAWTANHTLESATADVQGYLNKTYPDQGFLVEPKHVEDCVFGEKGLISSTQMSLEGANPYVPSTNKKLTKSEDSSSPFLYDQDGYKWVRGLLIGGDNPQKPKPNLYSHIRDAVTSLAGLPIYLRYEIQQTDNVHTA